jgi:hypothetical protein
LDHLLGCITPRVRILFQAAPRQTINKSMRRARLRDNFPESISP